MSAIDAKFALTAREREIVLAAVAGQISRRPGDAIEETLAVVAALNGEHRPILVWPRSMRSEEKVAWLEAQATEWRKDAQRVEQNTNKASSDSTEPTSNTAPTHKANEAGTRN